MGPGGLGERRLLLTAMLDGIYVDTIDERGVAQIQPKAAFKALFDIALEPRERRQALPESTFVQEHFAVPSSSG